MRILYCQICIYVITTIQKNAISNVNINNHQTMTYVTLLDKKFESQLVRIVVQIYEFSETERTWLNGS